MEKLTDRQKDIYEFINAFLAERGIPPTIREIGEHFGINSTNGVNEHVKALEKKGWVTRRKNISRGIMPVKKLFAPNQPIRSSTLDDNLIAIPLLGQIAAGEPILAEENIETVIYFDAHLLGRQKNIFLLKVNGHSMIGDGIYHGDMVFVAPQVTAENGRLVAAMVEDSATVKRFYKEKAGIRLEPSNPEFKTIFIPREKAEEVKILGVVLGVYRKFKF